MRNKRLTRALLSAAAAAAMLTATASAAWSDFSDGARIGNRKAVDALVELGVLTGRADNTFDPGGLTRRDEMAKMVSLLLDPQAAASGRYDGAAAELTDVAGSWARSYIGHCRSLGILSGKGDGRFDPEGTVTGTETAVMLLAASGYDTSAFTGPDWARLADRAATAAGLYAGFTAEPGQPLTRDGAALLLYNGLALLRGPRTIDLRQYGLQPQGIAVSGGEVLLTDSGQPSVVRIAGKKIVLEAGGSGARGYLDGDADESLFQSPWGIAPFLDGWAVSDPENGAVRLLQDGEVQTVNAKSAFTYPTGLAAGDDGSLYVADTHAGKILQITEAGAAKTVARGLSDPMGICWHDGALYIAETGANRIAKLENGRVTTLAGSGTEGRADGAAALAAFSQPKGVAVDGDGTVYVADTGAGSIRRIRDGAVSTLYAQETQGLYPVSPTGLLIEDGRLYVADSYAGMILIFEL